MTGALNSTILKSKVLLEEPLQLYCDRSPHDKDGIILLSYNFKVLKILSGIARIDVIIGLQNQGRYTTSVGSFIA